jgi:hypothetical protein
MQYTKFVLHTILKQFIMINQNLYFHLFSQDVSAAFVGTYFDYTKRHQLLAKGK